MISEKEWNKMYKHWKNGGKLEFISQHKGKDGSDIWLTTTAHPTNWHAMDSIRIKT